MYHLKLKQRVNAELISFAVFVRVDCIHSSCVHGHWDAVLRTKGGLWLFSPLLSSRGCLPSPICTFFNRSPTLFTAPHFDRPPLWSLGSYVLIYVSCYRWKSCQHPVRRSAQTFHPQLCSVTWGIGGGGAGATSAAAPAKSLWTDIIDPFLLTIHEFAYLCECVHVCARFFLHMQTKIWSLVCSYDIIDHSKTKIGKVPLRFLVFF